MQIEMYEIRDANTKRKVWEIFRKYHYLNSDLNTACRQFVGVLNGEIVCHTGVLPLPMYKNNKRLHRSVVLPDYQGIGIGMAFKKAVCDYLRNTGFTGRIWSVTTTPAQYHAQIKSPYWRLTRYGNAGLRPGILDETMKLNFASSSRRRITYSFVYVGDEQKERITP